MSCSRLMWYRSARKFTNPGNLGGPTSALTKPLENGLLHLSSYPHASPSTVKAMSPNKVFFRPGASPGEGDAETQNSPVKLPLVSPLLMHMINTLSTFCGGEIFDARLQVLSSEKWIHDVVHGQI